MTRLTRISGIATATWRERLASKGISPGPRRCHDGGCPVGGGDVFVHRCRGFDSSVGGRRASDAGGIGHPCRGVALGDCAAFASPSRAVDAAVTAQRALELPVRMGIATGEAELREGDYFGAVLNRAARVMAAGHGGQVLLAESTASLLSGVDLVDLGPRRLRDLPSAVGVFQVRAQGLSTEFPPLRALDVTPGNLRLQT